MPGFAAHGDDEVPAARGLGVDHQALHQADAVVARGLEAEGVDVGRQVEVVVDRLRHVHDLESTASRLLDLHCRERGIVAADRDQPRDAEAFESADGGLEQSGILGGVGARGAELRAAPKVDATHLVDGQRAHVIEVAAHQPLEPVLDAEHLDARESGADGGRPDDAVDAGRRAAANEDRKLGRVGHSARELQVPCRGERERAPGAARVLGTGAENGSQPRESRGRDSRDSENRDGCPGIAGGIRARLRARPSTSAS